LAQSIFSLLDTDGTKEIGDSCDSKIHFPFPTDPDDHCESPLQAYKDIVPLLEKVVVNDELRIYDPYYCDGSVKRNLQTLGFTNVHNVKKDCYQVWSKEGAMPSFDVLLTNP